MPLTQSYIFRVSSRALEVVPVLPAMLGKATVSAAPDRGKLPKGAASPGSAPSWESPDPRLALDQSAGLWRAFDADNVHVSLSAELLELILYH